MSAAIQNSTGYPTPQTPLLNHDVSEDEDSADGVLHENVATNKSTKQRRSRIAFVYLLTIFSAIGGFLFGYDTGVVAGAMLLLRQQFHLTSFWEELIVSITIGAAALFSIVGGYLNSRYGRKPVILFGSLVFSCGAVLLGFAVDKGMLLAGRFILGIGVGLTSTTIPMYIAESAPAEKRGFLVTLNNVFITGGQMVASIVDGGFSYDLVNGWRYMLGLAGIPAVIQFVGFFFLPESPRWLVQQGRMEEAKRVLCNIQEDPEREFDEIKTSCQETERAMSRINVPVFCQILRTPHVRRALLLGCMLQLFQQITGINTVMYYSATVIRMSGVKDQSLAIWLAAVTAATNFLFTFVGLYLVDRMGRRRLTLVSLTGTMLSLVVLAIGFQLAVGRSPPITVVETQWRNITVATESVCSNYSQCDPCMMDSACGFCYVDAALGPRNGSCLMAFVDKEGNTWDSKSAYGRCSKEPLPQSLTWAYDYCPTDVSWMPMFGLVLYLAAFAPGMGPMPWTVNSEIYPLWARSTGTAIATGVNWTSNLIISLTFLTLTEVLTRYGAFWLYASFAAVGLAVISWLLPETRGKSLEQIEELFKQRT